MDERIELTTALCHVIFHGIVTVPLYHAAVACIPHHPEPQRSPGLSTGLGPQEIRIRASGQQPVSVEHPVVI
ncbi:MAG: hypothetical protein VX633_00290, partial [Verrucomicrobiota bacterium]|nr:hypothetical protein [Verrucomicrobiota bacterium]